MPGNLSMSELGERMLHWHSSGGDPIYAVGSFYFSDMPYPDGEIVRRAHANLTHDLHEFERMLAGEEIIVRRNGFEVNLRKFAGYTDDLLRENIEDLSEIVDELAEYVPPQED